MCFHFKQSKTAQELKNRFNAGIEKNNNIEPAIYNGFQFPKTPIITNKQPEIIQLYHWGLIPFWAKDDLIKKSTLNARIETIHEKPSFKNITNNRCLILADAFYEWQWLDEKGKQKQKYEITLPNDETFAFAGLWSIWTNSTTGELIETYTILTCVANNLLSKIHNTKKRMPIIIAKNDESSWLIDGKINMQNDLLTANKESNV